MKIVPVAATQNGPLAGLPGRGTCGATIAPAPLTVLTIIVLPAPTPFQSRDGIGPVWPPGNEENTGPAPPCVVAFGSFVFHRLTAPCHVLD